MAASDERFVTLANGVRMPYILLGTWKSPPGKAREALRVALEAGYRGIDCANDYGNEPEIGKLLKELFESGALKREDIFIQAKLWNTNHRKEHVRADLVATLEDLNISYVDSFVIHWPQACPATGKAAIVRKAYTAPAEEGSMFPLEADGRFSMDEQSHFVETWHAMEELYEEGLAKSIGLSNFNIAQIREVIANAKKHQPMLLQNERHPYLQLKDLQDFCKLNNIHLQAYSPLGSKDRPAVKAGDPELMEDQRIKAIGDKYGKSIAQVVLRWHVQTGVSCCPKSVTPSRVKENNEIWDFTLTPEDMAEFDRFNIGYRFLLWSQTSMHPDYPFKDDLPRDFVPDVARPIPKPE